ncbi:MAG: TatD family hydrolase [Clostridiales bacterium]|jgi:TatD DNase family protein|nr:TatD family hydrolase [Clostridiales bacterium]
MLIDAHAHLNDERLTGLTDEILALFGEYGVESAVCASYDERSSVVAAELAEKYENVFAAAAFHPHEAKSYTQEHADLFRRLAAKKSIVAIGETGLDYYYDLSPREVQRRVFAEHLALADELKLPVVVHVRDAYEDTLGILSGNAARLRHGVLIHNFSGDAEIMRRFNAFDCYYSFGGTLTFKNNKRGIEAFLNAPRERVLLETDCPYLTPAPHRGKLNFPYYVRYVAEKGSELLGVPYTEFDALTNGNTKRFYGLK